MVFDKLQTKSVGAGLRDWKFFCSAWPKKWGLSQNSRGRTVHVSCRVNRGIGSIKVKEKLLGIGAERNSIKSIFEVKTVKY